MLTLLNDVRYAGRALRKSPGFTAVALISIALGIGANTAIFTLVDRILLRLLPVRDPEQLVLLTSVGSHYGSNRGGNMLSFPMYEDFRDAFSAAARQAPFPRASAGYDTTPKEPIFSGVLARRQMAFGVGYAGETERVTGELVSGTYFEVLGVGTVLGRPIGREDDVTPGGHPVAVLSHDYWRTRFDADPEIVGQTIVVNGVPLTIIGVSEPGFAGLDIAQSPQVRVPMMMKAEMTPQWVDLDNRRSRWVNVFGRLEPGVSAERAKAVLQPFFHGLLEAEVREPAFSRATPYAREQFLQGQIDVLPGSQGRAPVRAQLARPLWLLMGIVFGVLLIACANVAGLLTARSTAREREIAIRLALGATRRRLVAQLLVESLLLAALGGLAGLVVAAWTSRLLVTLLPTGETSLVISTAPDLRVLGFSFALALLTGMLFGLAPALRATRPSLAPTLKDQIGTVAGGASVRFRKVLVVAQVTLSLLLLAGAGLFIRSLQNLRDVDLGIETVNVLAFRVDPAGSGFTPEQTKQFFRRLLERIQGEPGVRRASIANMPLLTGDEWDSSFTVEGHAAAPGENMQQYMNMVGPDYFETIGIPLLAGRAFTDRDEVPMPQPDPDDPGAPDLPFQVAIVNEKFATHYFGDANPIGRRIGFGGDPGTPTPIEIVGVVGDAKYTGVRDEIPRQVFVSYLESPFQGEMTVYVQTEADATTMFNAMRRTLRELNPDIPMYNERTLESQVARSLVVERLVAILSSVFSVLATVLAIVGLYGVMAYTVARRTRELGVRMALGAGSRDVTWLVMREVLALVGVGLALGSAATWAVARLVATRLYGVAPSDPSTIGAAAALLAVVATAAGYVPAWRATRVKPSLALRHE